MEPLVLQDAPFLPCTGPALTKSHIADDPGFARAQRRLARTAAEAARQGVAGEEQYDQPEEQYNEVGDPIEPFHMRRELEEGTFAAGGTYMAFKNAGEKDAWLQGLETEVMGTGGEGEEREAGEARGKNADQPIGGEEIAELPPLSAPEVLQYKRRLAGLLQPRECAQAALQRLAGTGAALTKFSTTSSGERRFHERMHHGHTVAPGNLPTFDAITEATEVLFDAGVSRCPRKSFCRGRKQRPSFLTRWTPSLCSPWGQRQRQPGRLRPQAAPRCRSPSRCQLLRPRLADGCSDGKDGWRRGAASFTACTRSVGRCSCGAGGVSHRLRAARPRRCWRRRRPRALAAPSPCKNKIPGPLQVIGYSN